MLKPFYLFRHEDESGVSGTGVVALGVQLPTGRCILEWTVAPHTMGFYESLEDVTLVHGHDGKTEVRVIQDVDELVHGAISQAQLGPVYTAGPFVVERPPEEAPAE